MATPTSAADLAEVIAAHGGQADVLGHSMGGKAAMALALTHPRAVRRLIVADIAPVAYGHTQQHLGRRDARHRPERGRDAGRRPTGNSPPPPPCMWRRPVCAPSFCSRWT